MLLWIIEVQVGHVLLQLHVWGSSFNCYLVRRAWNNLFQFPNKMPMKANHKTIGTHWFKMKRQPTDCQNLGKLSSKPASVMRSGSTFVSLFCLFVCFLFFASRHKAKSFLEEERWCSGTLSHCLLSTQKQKNYTHRKTERQTWYWILSQLESCSRLLVRASSLPSPLCTVGAPQTPRDWGMGNQGRPHPEKYCLWHFLLSIGGSNGWPSFFLC